MIQHWWFCKRNLDELDSITKFNDFLDLINATPGFTFVVECKGAPVSEIIKAMDEKNIDYDNQIIFFSFKSEECEQLINMKRGFRGSLS